MAKYLFFSTPTCIKCPAVKQYLETVTLPGEHINAATAEGLNLARKYRVMSTPTVIILDEDGQEINRAQNLPEIKKCCQ